MAIWVGGATMFRCSRCARCAPRIRSGSSTSRRLSFIGSRILTPKSLLVVLSGVWMVIDY
jgi:hypothetical protein